MVRNNMLSYVSLASCSMLGKVNLWCHNTKAKSCIHYWSTIYQCNFLVAIGWTYRRVFFKYAFLNTNIMLHLNTQFQIESGLGHLLCNMWKYVQIITFADSEKLCWTINVSYTCYMLKAYALLKVAEHVFCIMLSWPPCSEAACVCALLLPPTWRSPLFLLAPKQLKKNFWEASSFYPTAKQPKKSPAQGMAGLIMFRSSPQCTTSTFNLIFFQPWTSLLPHPLPRSIQLYNGCHPPRRSRSDHNSAQLPGPGCLLLFLY